jgi:hypothetical protein
MQTNRLRFINVDQSYSVGSTTTVTGACVIKASKGLNRPQFVQKGDTQTFLNLFGAPSSLYPGVQEAMDFLQNYSLWVSAPGGTSSSLKLYSYYGGVYLTTLASMEAFHEVTEDNTGNPSINYLTNIYPSKVSPFAGASSSAYDSGAGTITITNIPAALFNIAGGAITNLIVTYTRPDTTVCSVKLDITFTSFSANSINFTNSTATSNLGTNSITLNTNTNMVTIVITGLTTQNAAHLTATIGTTNYYDLNFKDIANFSTACFNQSTLQWVLNIEPYAIMGVYQTSPRTTIGTMALTSAYSVDTRTQIASRYKSTFTLIGTGPGTSAYAVSVCGITLNITPSGTTPTNVATAINTAFQASVGSFLGYTCSSSNENVIIEYNSSQLAPTLVLSSTVFPALFVKYRVVYTFPAGLTATVAQYTSFTLAGVTASLATAPATTAAVITAIKTAYNALSSSYTLTDTATTLTIDYTTEKAFPSLYLSSGFSPYTATLTTNPTSLATGASVVANANYNTVTFTYGEQSYPGYNFSRSYTVSPLSTQTDAQGNSQFADTVLSNDNFLHAISFKTTLDPLSGYIWNPSTQYLQGSREVNSEYFVSGTPSQADISNVLTQGWNLISTNDLQNVSIFFDPECDPNTATTMSNLRSSTFTFATFITGIKVAAPISVSTSDNNTATNAIITARALLPNTTGLAYYCNEFYQTETYNGTYYWNSAIGSTAAMLARIMDSRLGGAAPMFTNEGSPAVGGQISKNVLKQKYSFNADNLDTLDAAGVNPIILDNFYGLMITSQKTAQSSMTLTDWSYLGHQMSFDLFERDIKNNVMLPQIGKLIDNFHMQLRKDQARIWLNKRLSGPTAIWSEGQVFVQEVNTPETKAQNNFMMKIRVKVTPFSDYVTLIFNNVAQTSSVTTV